jgi:cell division protein FtsL
MIGVLQFSNNKSGWLVVVLWLSTLVSSLMVVYASYQTRLKVNELSVLRAEEDKLHLVWSKYLLEESAWASYGRVERMAIEQLLMKVPLSQQIVMVKAYEE